MWRNATSYTATLLLPHLKSQTRTPLCFLSSTGAIKTVKRNFSHSYWLSFMLQKTSHSPRWSKCRCPEAFRSMLWKFSYFKYNLVKYKKIHCLAEQNLFWIIRKYTTFYVTNLNASAINWKSEPPKKSPFHKNLWLGNDFLVVCKLSSHFFQTCIL